MSVPLEDYALIGDCHTAAVVSKQGSIDWLCVPRFDSGAIFAALLGNKEHGYWQIAPAGEVRQVTRKYRDATLILETRFKTDAGEVELVDFMAERTHFPELMRIVRGVSGQVPMRMELAIRCEYGAIVPWVRRIESGVCAIGGPDGVVVYGDVEMHGENLTTVADFTVSAGAHVTFSLSWHPSYQPRPPRPDCKQRLTSTTEFWKTWSDRCTYQGQWRQKVLRSLITIKALTYAPTGGIVAAPTTSLPEKLGGVRNWDYRYCWVRDATFCLDALMASGYTEEALAWRDWLLRAVAGKPSELNILYGVAGERRLPELEIDWLPGYANSRPVRTGNQAYRQYQLDVYGELFDALYQSQKYGVEMENNTWRMEQALIGFLEKGWHEPDDGIWEVRGPRRHFTHSKVMAWVAFDRIVKAVEQFGMDGPVDRWRAEREAIHQEVCARGIDPGRGCFVQYYGSKALDASLLMIPLVGFLPASDKRMQATIAAIEKDLMHDNLVWRYPTETDVDGLPPGEGVFLICSFWLVDNLALSGRRQEAVERFEKLAALTNDVGLLAEEYDPHNKRMLGNFPQALSHVALIESALNLAETDRVHRRDPRKQT